MENKKPTTGKFGLIYGVIASVIGIIFTFMLIAGDMLYDPSPIKSIVQILIFVLVVIVAIISIIFMYLLSSVIVPDFWEKTAEISRITIQEQNPSLTADQVENAIEMQNKFSWIMYPAILIMNLFIGFVTALITGLILKKTENLD